MPESFLLKLEAWSFFRIFKNNFFGEHLSATASEHV